MKAETADYLAKARATLVCKDRPLDRATFRDPIGFLGRTVRAPRVALDSRVIVQRHVNALIFSAFVRQLAGDAFKMQAGGFFGCPSGARAAEQPGNAAAQLIEFATKPTTRQALSLPMQALTRGSALEGDPEIFDRATGLMKNVREDFAREWRALQDLRGQRTDDDKAANRGLEIQIRRLCEDYLLSVLSARGFLPGHGFPSGVVSFLCRTDPPKPENASEERARFNGYPQRALDVAIREYAPGAEIVLDGLVHRSEGVTLNWRRPATADGVREIQNLLWRWRCPACGESGSQRTKEAEFCASCNATALSWQQYLQPAGFAADLRKDPHADPDEVSYIAPQTPAVSARGAVWMPLPDPIDGRRRATRSGSVFFSNAGQGRRGYTICLSCGRAQEPSLATDGTDPSEAIVWVHKPLLGKSDSGGDCPGAHQPFSVKQRLLLGHEIATDVFELQAANIGSRGAYLALAIALREALARRICVEPEAMGVAVALRGGLAGPVFSAFLFDRAVGGAGFAVQADPLLLEILPEAVEILDCKVPGCRRGCPACVLTGDLSEDDADGLDRLTALEGARRLAANAAPRPEDHAHPAAQLVADALDIINRDSVDANRIVLRLAAPLDPAGLGSWRAAGWVRQSARPVVVSVPTGSVAVLDGAARLALRDRLSQWGATIEEAADAVLPNGARVIAEVIRPETTCVLATRDPDAFIGDADWARPSTAPIVRFEQSGATLAGTAIPIGCLIPARGAILRGIGAECDGSLRGFGSRMAKLISDALAEAGAPLKAQITALAYSDRYFSSPLVARLGIDTFAHLAKPNAANPLDLSLRIAALRWNDFTPSRVEHDWKHEDDRTSVVSRYAARLGFKLTLIDPLNIPHSRALSLTYSTGTRADIYLDQGFGTWRPTRRTEFRFNLYPNAQVDELAQLDASLVSSTKTHVVVQIRAD